MVLPKFSIDLGGTTIYVNVEVINTTLDYSLLLGCIFFYAMTTIVLSIFHVLYFPHEGNIVTIYQLYYCIPSTQHSTTKTHSHLWETTLVSIRVLV